LEKKCLSKLVNLCVTCWSPEAAPLDTVKNNEAFRDGLLAVTLGIWEHVKNGPREKRKLGQPGMADVLDAANWAFDGIGFASIGMCRSGQQADY
jgi:hypothetical protein